jgi:hypothetical protein
MRSRWLAMALRVAVAAAFVIALVFAPGSPRAGAGGPNSGEPESGRPFPPGRSDSGNLDSRERSADEPVTARKSGAGFEFRRRLPSVRNPYCQVVTYVVRELATGASSTQDGNGQAVIVIDAGTLKTDPDYAQFLMAHECCHHSLGHIKLRTGTSSRLGPQPFYYLLPKLKGMELEADACAIRLLKLNGAGDAIESARAHMLTFGNLPTGAYYPTGVERAENIAHVGGAVK